MIKFEKYHGTGNDFILVDDRIRKFEPGTETIRNLCDRHFGIGADGLILLRNSTDYDFEMLYFNSDGLPGSMCGNGGRCAVVFANALGIIKSHTRFTAFDGPHEALLVSDKPNEVKLHMNNVSDVENNNDFIFLNTGSPHYVTFVDNLNVIDILQEGRKVRYSERFKKDGVNVNFVNEKNGILNVRTYERGVEDETLSCGTGVTASVLAAAFSGRIQNQECLVNTPGGHLKVYFKKDGNGFSDIWLEGPVAKVFSGEVDLK